MEAINRFLSTFGVPVYTENGVPEDAVLPYISYTPVVTPWDGSSVMPVRIWDRSTSWIRSTGIADALQAKIGEGVRLEVPGGYVCLYQGDPWAQPQPSAPEMKQIYINIGIATIAI